MNVGKTNILTIQKEKYEYTIHQDGIRLKSNKEDQFIPNKEIFSIRFIKLYQFELYIYLFITFVGFSLWWVVGLIFTLYTFAQYAANLRVVLLTDRGQMIFKFGNADIKNIFLEELKKTKPEAFSIKKWFRFRKERKED